jgi:hypothetical protein
MDGFMPKPTQDPSWTIEDLYNFVMVSIEPDLVLGRIEQLDALYAGETEQERKSRADRYAAAFERCFAIMEQLLQQWTLDIDTFKRDLLNTMKVKEEGDQGEMLKKISHSLDAQ